MTIYLALLFLIAKQPYNLITQQLPKFQVWKRYRDHLVSKEYSQDSNLTSFILEPIFLLTVRLSQQHIIPRSGSHSVSTLEMYLLFITQGISVFVYEDLRNNSILQYKRTYFPRRYCPQTVFFQPLSTQYKFVNGIWTNKLVSDDNV